MTISVLLNEANFEYDIHSLVQAFYPGCEVVVRASEDELPAEADVFIRIDYLESESRIKFRIMTEPVLEDEADADFSDRPETKNALKLKLYELLSKVTGRTLPWGTLTGIRPTKIPMAMIEEGASDADIYRYMKGKYLVSDRKIALGTEVARREEELLKGLDYDNGYSLYVGIPFCPTTCAYCSFTSFPIEKWKERVDEYLDALEKEMAFASAVCRGRTLGSVYIGGGTPTSLLPRQLDRLIGDIKRYFPQLEAGIEFTVEGGRPDSITEEKLAVLKEHGISRISINPQTMNDKTLKLIGRRHSTAQIIESFHMARDMGFDNINMDMIVGLPDEDYPDVAHTLDELGALGPDSITVHSLAIKRAARIRTSREDFERYHMENSDAIMELTQSRCADMGLYPYYLYRQKNMAGNFENVGYARPGCEGIYNILIMEEKQSIIALGAGAVSKLVLDGGSRIERVGNVKDITNYLNRIDEMIDRKRRKMEEEGWL